MCMHVCLRVCMSVCVHTSFSSLDTNKYVITHKNEIVFVNQVVLFRKLPDCFILYLFDFLPAWCLCSQLMHITEQTHRSLHGMHRPWRFTTQSLKMGAKRRFAPKEYPPLREHPAPSLTFTSPVSFGPPAVGGSSVADEAIDFPRMHCCSFLSVLVSNWRWDYFDLRIFPAHRELQLLCSEFSSGMEGRKRKKKATFGQHGEEDKCASDWFNG